MARSRIRSVACARTGPISPVDQNHHVGSVPVIDTPIEERFVEHWRRYEAGEYRSAIFADVLLNDMNLLGGNLTVLDIGCGGGFDGNVPLQRRIGTGAARFLGVEPADDVTPDACFHKVHRCLLEQAPIAPGSVDLAYAVMVAEHVADPVAFMRSVADALRKGGVFWAFTIDARHWSAWMSMFLERTHLKSAYMDALLGARGKARWRNYPVEYKLNSPSQLARYCAAFERVESVSLHRVGAEDSNLPAFLRGPNRLLDAALIAAGAPGSNFVFRAIK